jgi:ethanolamine utilization protein EutA (predicted chaperonin)
MNASDLYNESTYYERNDSEVYDSSRAVKYEHLEKYEQLTEMYEKMCDILKEFTLAPRKPILIYADNSFVTKKLEDKYLPIIQNKLNKIYVNNLCLYEDTGSFTDISEVIKITKKTEIVEPSIIESRIIMNSEKLMKNN